MEEGSESRIESLQKIADYTYSLFLDAEERNKSIDNLALARWARAKYRELGCKFAFDVSEKWLVHFKRTHHISDRKITKFVRVNHSKNQAKIIEETNKFVENFKAKTANYLPSHIFNTDQTGMKFEQRRGRSLATTGTKKILKESQSVNATKHSFTAQPCISQDGKLQLPVLVCWQEHTETGEFGPRVAKTMYRPSNLHIVSSKSGLMSKALSDEWFEKVYLPNAPKESVLLLDAWNGYGNQDHVNELANKLNSQCTLYKIPGGGTEYIQPLDCGFNRTWNQFDRYFYDRVVMDDLDIQVTIL